MLSLDGEGTLVDRLVRALRSEVARWPVGARMPPTRALARDLGISRNTVVDAYGALATDGLIAGRFGGGSYVSRLDRSTSAPDESSLAWAPRPGAAEALAIR